MLGNVAEWVNDWFGPYGLDSRADPQGPDGGVYKILRGGSWTDDFSFMKRISYRNTSFLGFQDSAVGFRICRSVE